MLDQWLCLLDVLLWMLKLQLWLGSPVVLGPAVMDVGPQLFLDLTLWRLIDWILMWELLLWLLELLLWLL